MNKLTSLLSPNTLSITNFGLLLQKCLKSKALKPGKQIHAMLLLRNIDMNSLSLHSKLVSVYANSADLASANSLFRTIKNPNVFAFNWMISSSAFHGFHNEAIGYFRLMFDIAVSRNLYTYSAVLKACAGLMDLKMGKAIHGMVIKGGFDCCHFLVLNGLIDVYCKCGSLDYARIVFDKMIERDVVSWTCMICGYCNDGKIQHALGLFERMKLDGLKPNEFTWNAIIASYARIGDCNGAIGLLFRMKEEGLVPDVVTWNAMISGFSQSLRATEALELFRDMLGSGIRPNDMTVTGLLPACGLTNLVQRGKEIHAFVYKMRMEINVYVASALIDMYSKCGNVNSAWNVFEHVSNKNVACWNAMIGCYGKHGMVDSSIKLFERMQDEEMQANQVTLICVLSACSHGGLVEKGLKIFKSIQDVHRVKVTKEHFSCIVDLLCRSGRMVEAYEFIKEMPIQVTDSIVGAFINGCKIHGRIDLAKLMINDTLRMDLNRPGSFVTISNIYAAEEEWEEAENVRKVMKENGVHKMSGSSWVESLEIIDDLHVGKESKQFQTREADG